MFGKKRKTKTVLMTYTLQEGAVSDFMQTITRKIIKKGYRVVVITDKKRKDLVSYDTNPVILTWPSYRPIKIKDAKFLYRVLKKYKPSLSISLFGSINLTLLLGFLLGIQHRIPWARSTSRGVGRPSFYKKWRKKFVLALATKIFANSKATKRDLMELYHIPPHKIDVFYNAIRIPQQTFGEKNYNRITYAGRLHPTKGVHILIKAFSDVLKKNPHAELIILGDGPFKNELIKLTKELQIENNVIFKGIVPHKKVFEYFATSAFVVVPSFFEAFGYVIIEAFAVKTPVIAANSEGPAEIVRHKTDGFLFEPGNVNQLAEYMDILLKNPSLIREMGNNAYKRVQENFEINKVSEEVATTVDKLCKSLYNE